MNGLTRLADNVAALAREVEELRRIQENTIRVGTVADVDAAKGLARIDIGTDKNPLISDWRPWTEQAGAIKTWVPPSIGEQVRLISPAGEIAAGWIDRGGFSDTNPQPHDRPAEAVLTIGDTRITKKGDEVRIETPTAVVIADKVELGDEGGPAVARIGDLVNVTFGSSKGLHPIVTGSSIVNAAG